MPEMPFSNGLTDAERERLAWLIEECGEVIKACGKILRHGYGDTTSKYDNRGDLEEEIGHVGAAVGLMKDNNDIKHEAVITSQIKKHTSVRPYMYFQNF